MYCKRYENLVHFFKMEMDLVACTDIDGLMQTLSINHIPLDWRLFIDSSKLSLKAVLLHNGSNLTSIHYSRKDWPARKSLESGIMNVENQPLVELCKILLPCLYLYLNSYLKLGLTKNSVKTMNQEEPAFTYLRERFPRLSEAKLKEGIFIGPQIRDLIKDEYFEKLLQGDEKAVWESFKFVVKGFLGNRRAQNYEELVNKVLQSYKKLGCNMSLKIHFLHPHLDFSQRIVVQ